MNFKWSGFWLGCALFAIGVIGGGAVSWTVAGWPGAFFAWKLGFCFLILRTIVAAVIWQLGRSNIRYFFYSRAVLIIDMSMFLVGGGFPVFFIIPIWTVLGFILLAACLLSAGIHTYLSVRHFNSQWKSTGESAIEKSVKGDRFDADKFTKHLDLSPPLFDMRNELLGFAFKAALIISMLVGLSMRKLFPEFAALAWGLPALLLLSWTAQAVVGFVLQANAVTRYEKRTGRTLKWS